MTATDKVPVYSSGHQASHRSVTEICCPLRPNVCLEKVLGLLPVLEHYCGGGEILGVFETAFTEDEARSLTPLSVADLCPWLKHIVWPVVLVTASNLLEFGGAKAVLVSVIATGDIRSGVSALPKSMTASHFFECSQRA